MSERTFGRWDAFKALCLARFREFYRESEVIFWSFLFPIFLAIGLGVAFRNQPMEVLPVGVVDGEGAERVLAVLEASPLLKVRRLGEAEAHRDLTMARLAVVVIPEGNGVRYRLDDTRPESVLARTRVDDALQRAAGRTDVVPTREEKVTEPGARYIDFLIPGMLGLNLMSGGMWGMGFHLVDMRIKKLLKRLIATPMNRADFMLSQMVMRVIFVFIEVALLLGFGRLAFGMPVRGSIAAILFLGVLGALTFGGLGLLVGSRAQTIEKVTGLMNLVMMPMFVCSGVFFSVERFPDAVRPFVALLPLTALNDALRAVILEGASLASQAVPLAVLGTWALVSFVAGLKLFRWN